MANDKDFKVKNNLNVQGGTIYLDEGSETVKLVGNSNLDVYSDNLVKFFESDGNTLRATFDLNDNKFQFGSSSSTITDSQTHTVAISGAEGLKVSGTGYFGGNVSLLGNIVGHGVTTGSSGSILRNVFLNPAAEDGHAINPLVVNDMAGATYWGEITNVSGFYKVRSGTSGSYTYSSAVTATDSGWPAAFDGTSSTAGSWYTDDGVDGTTQGTGTFIVDFDGQKTVNWTASVGIVFGSAGFTAEKVKIECYRNGAWQTECDISNNTSTAVLRKVANNNGSGVTKVRYTIGSATGGGYFRIHSCFIMGNSAGAHGTLANSGVFYLPKYGDAYQHGSFIPSLNDTYNIGNATFKHQTIYAMNLDAATSIKTGGVTRIDSSGNLTSVQGAFLGLSGGTITGALILGATTSNNYIHLDSSSNKSSYTAYTSGSSGFSIGIPDQTQNKLVITNADSLVGGHLFTLDNTGAVTIAPPALAGVQDGLILYDRTDGNSNGLRIKWKSGTDADTAELIGQSFDQLLVKTGGDDRGKFGSSGLYLNNGLQVDSSTNSSSTGGINFTLDDDIADQAFTGVRIDHNISGSQAINAGEDYSHIGLYIDQDSTSIHTGTNPTVDEHRMYGLYVDSRGTGVSDLRRGVYSYAESQHSAGQVSEVTAGSFSAVADETGTGRTLNTHGVYGLAQGYASGTGGDNNLFGGYFKSILTSSQTKNAANVTGVFADVEIDDPSTATTVANLRAFWGEIDNDDTGDNRTVTNAYLFYGNYVGDLPATNNWGIYIADDVRSYFSGSITTKLGVEATPSFSFNGDTNTGMWSPAGDTLAFSTGGSERVRINSSGNVGIGTISPSSVLDVAGSAAVLTITDTRNQSFTVGDTMCSLAFDSDDASGSAGTASHPRALISLVAETTFGSSTGLSFSTKQDTASAPTEKMRINTAGNVGIGTPTPNARLHVNPGTNFSKPSLIIDSPSGYSEGDLYVLHGRDVNTGIGFSATGFGVNIQEEIPSDNIPQLRSNTGGLTSAGLMYVGADEAAQGVFGVMGATGSAGTDLEHLFTVRSSGNVGIGTTAPTSLLHLSASSYPKITLNDETGVDRAFSLGTSNETFVIRNETASSDAVSIDQNNKVGIGTTSPNAPLEIHGADIATGATTTASSVLRLVRDVVDPTHTLRKDSAVDFMLSRQQAVANNLPYTRLDIRLSGTTDTSSPTLDVMSLLHNGNVGIGTSSPDALLDLEGNFEGNSNFALKFTNTMGTGAVGGFRSHGTNGEALTIYQDGARKQSWASNSITFYGASDAEIIRFNNSGRVGIGTSLPDGNLHIKSVGDVGDATLIIEADNDNNVEGDNPRIELRQDGGLVTSAIYLEGEAGQTAANTLTNSLILDSKGSINNQAIQCAVGGRAAQQSGGETDSTVQMTILGTNGKVGIGTTAPDEKLVVRGANYASDQNGGIAIQAGDDTSSHWKSAFKLKSNATGNVRTTIDASTGQTGGQVNEAISISTAGKVGIGTAANPNKNLHVYYANSDSTVATGNALAGGAAGSGVLIQNTSTSGNTYANLDFRARDADGRIAYQYDGSSNKGDFHFITDEGAPSSKLTIKGNGQVGINNTNPTNGWLSVQMPANEGNVYAAEFFGTLTYQPPNSTVHNVISNGVYIQAGGVMGGLTDYALMVKNREATSTLLSVKGSGNVGIGTALPVQPLQVSGNIYSNGGDFFVDAGRGITSVDSLVLEADENNNGNNTYIAFRTDGSEKARMNSTGHLGLGTDKPITPLHITEAGGGSRPSDVLTIETTRSDVSDAFTGGAIKFVNSDSNSAGMARIKVGSSNDATDNPIGLNSEPSQSFIFETSVGTSVGITSIDGNATTITVVHSTHTFAVGQKIAINTGSYAGSYYINTVTSDTQFTIADTDHDLDQYTGSAIINYGTPRDSMIIRADGNVGIGTNSPDRRFHVSGSGGTIALKAEATDTSQASVDLKTSNSWFRMIAASGELSFYDQADSAERLRIDTSGNVGIGTNSPNEILHVQDVTNAAGTALTIQNAYGESPKSIKFRYNDTVETARITAFGRNETENLPYLAFLVNQTTSSTASNSVTERMRIDNAGNVGIGTDSPTSKLHISNNAAPADDLTLLTLQNGNGTSDITTPDTWIDFVFKDSNVNAFPQARIGAHAGQGGDANSQELEGNGYLTFHTSNPGATTTEIDPPERMRIAHNGHVGIGNTSPTNGILSVVAPANKGNVYAAEFTGTLPYTPPNSTVLNTSSNGVRIRAGGSILEEYALRIQNQSGSSELFCVQGDGDVGIGTNTPQDALDVTGTVRISQNLRFGTGQTVSSIETTMATSPTDTQLLTAQGVKEYVDNNSGTYGVTTGGGLALDGTNFELHGSEIAGSVNLNTMRTTGIFPQNSNNDASSGSNYPQDLAGILEVIEPSPHAGGNSLHTIQRYSIYNSTKVWHRYYYNGTWSSWVDLTADTNDNTTYTAGDGLTLTGTDFDINKGSSGDWWGDKVVHIPADGVIEVAKYLDWHSTDAGTSDFDYRMTAGVNSMTFSNELLVQGDSKTNSTFRVESSGDLLKVNITAWSANAVQSILHNGYGNNTGDNIVLKCAGNGTSHGAIFVGDNVFSYGKCNSAADTDNNVTDPLPNGTAFSVTAAGAASFESSVSSGSDMTISTNASSHGRIVSNRLLIDSATEFVVGSTIGSSFENSITCTANGSTSLYYDGSFRIGTVTDGVSVTGDLDVTGAISGTTKSFDIEHPTKKGKRLHHGVLEGPEHAVYIRGRSKNSTIELPEYWLGLVHEETITVQLTAIGKSVDLYVKDIINNSIEVENDCEYFYFIQAERKDVERFEVEYEQ